MEKIDWFSHCFPLDLYEQNQLVIKECYFSKTIFKQDQASRWLHLALIPSMKKKKRNGSLSSQCPSESVSSSKIFRRKHAKSSSSSSFCNELDQLAAVWPVTPCQSKQTWPVQCHCKQIWPWSFGNDDYMIMKHPHPGWSARIWTDDIIYSEKETPAPRPKEEEKENGKSCYFSIESVNVPAGWSVSWFGWSVGWSGQVWSHYSSSSSLQSDDLDGLLRLGRRWRPIANTASNIKNGHSNLHTCTLTLIGRREGRGLTWFKHAGESGNTSDAVILVFAVMIIIRCPRGRNEEEAAAVVAEAWIWPSHRHSVQSNWLESIFMCIDRSGQPAARAARSGLTLYAAPCIIWFVHQMIIIPANVLLAICSTRLWGLRGTIWSARRMMNIHLHEC